MSALDLRREENEKIKNELIDKLKSVGIVADTNQQLLEPEDKSPEEHLYDVETRQLEFDVQAYQTIELMRQNLMGVHSCEIVIGKCKIGVAFQGMDLFDLIPLIPSVSELKKEFDMQTRAATAEAVKDGKRQNKTNKKGSHR
jgi:hypothetical protein